VCMIIDAVIQGHPIVMYIGKNEHIVGLLLVRPLLNNRDCTSPARDNVLAALPACGQPSQHAAQLPSGLPLTSRSASCTA
jgi:hypothetical protein